MIRDFNIPDLSTKVSTAARKVEVLFDKHVAASEALNHAVVKTNWFTGTQTRIDEGGRQYKMTKSEIETAEADFDNLSIELVKAQDSLKIAQEELSEAEEIQAMLDEQAEASKAETLELTRRAIKNLIPNGQALIEKHGRKALEVVEQTSEEIYALQMKLERAQIQVNAAGILGFDADVS